MVYQVNKKVSFHIRISPELRKQLFETAKQLGLSPSEVARQALSYYLLSVANKKKAVEEL